MTTNTACWRTTHIKGCGDVPRSNGLAVSYLKIGAWLLMAALPAFGRVPPSQMMANVYRLTEASAVLDVCFESPGYKALPTERGRVLRGLSNRLGDLVRSIGMHYGDEGLYQIYESTKPTISSDSKLRLHVKNYYQYCGDRLAREMEAYVSENEKLINEFLKKQSPRPGR
jgi:hypothetical protein